MTFGVLLETALAGSQRRDVPAAVPGLANLPPASRLLRSASYEGLRRLAGRPPGPVEDIIAVEPCAAETLPPIPPAAGERLLEIVNNRPGLLVEWFCLAAERNWRLTHDCLPDLLDYARSDPDVQDLVTQVGGERLVWLAGLNPDWRFAARVDPDEQFAFGTPEERARALLQIRRHSTERGRKLVQGVLDGHSEHAATRAALLSVLAEGLSADDEPLLLQAVHDARKEVRESGLRLIRRVPDSRFGQRWADRAHQLVAVGDGTSGTRIEVREPAAIDPAWLLDGLDPRPPKGVGATAWALQQVVALSPPSIWPHQALAAIKRSDWSQPLLSGLARAAVAYADADWCEDLLMELEAVPGTHPAALLGALTADRGEAVVSRLLEMRAHRSAALAGGLRHAWSEQFSRTMVARLPYLLRKHQYAVSGLLHEAPLRLDPRVLPEAVQIVENLSLPAWAHAALQRLVSALEFRAAMRRELEGAIDEEGPEARGAPAAPCASL